MNGSWHVTDFNMFCIIHLCTLLFSTEKTIFCLFVLVKTTLTVELEEGDGHKSSCDTFVKSIITY